MNTATSYPRDYGIKQESNSLVHDVVTPGEVYPGDGISAVIIEPGAKSPATQIPVYRISPLGVELCIPHQMQDLIRRFQTGTRINLQIRIMDRTSEFQGVTILTTQQHAKGTLVGVRWCDAEPVKAAEGASIKGNEPREERRGATRWSCGLDFTPSGIAPNPTRFNDFVHFRVLDISLAGMLWITSLRNRFVIPGMLLEGNISFPMSSQVSVKARVANTRIVDINGKKYLGLGMRVEETGRNFTDVVGQYVFQFGSKSSIEKLKKEGFRVPKASQAIEFSFVRNENEYREVLDLRLAAYKAAGKLPSTATAEDTADVFDTRSRILIAKYRNEIVASCRIIFHEPEDPYEFEEFTNGVPDGIPPKHECVEVSRLCVNPAYRQSDVFYHFMKELALISIKSNRRYICAFACDDISPLYVRIGAKLVGARFSHPGLANKEHEIVAWDIVSTVTGAGIGPLVWGFMCSQLVVFLDQTKMMQFTALTNLRFAFYRTLFPIAHFLFGKVRAQARKAR